MSRTIAHRTASHLGFEFEVDNREHPLDPCSRCGGSGHYLFNGYDDICYLCGGIGWNHAVTSNWTEYVQILKRRDRSAKRRSAKREALIESAMERSDRLWNARLERIANRPLLTELTYWPNANDDFEGLKGYWKHPKLVRIAQNFCTIATRVWVETDQKKPDGTFYKKQIDATDEQILAQVSDSDLDWAEEYLRTEIAKLSNAIAVPEGRYQITGIITSCKWRSNDFGGSFKAVIIDDRGFKVWGTMPTSLMETNTEEDLINRRITLTATVKAGEEKGFGFYSRPAKAALLEK